MSTSPSPAPSVLGLHPDDAARVCFALGLDFSIENQWQVSWWGAGEPDMRVVEQRPPADTPTTTVEVRVGFRGGADGAGVRELRQPLSPLRSDGVEREDMRNAD